VVLRKNPSPDLASATRFLAFRVIVATLTKPRCLITRRRLIASSALSRRQLLMICLILSKVPNLIAVDALVSTVPGTVMLVQSPLSAPALPASAVPAPSVVIFMLKVLRRLVSSVSHLNPPVCFALRLRIAALPVFVVQLFQVSRLVVLLILLLNWSCVNVLLIASMRLVLVASSLQTCFAIQLHLLMQWELRPRLPILLLLQLMQVEIPDFIQLVQVTTPKLHI